MNKGEYTVGSWISILYRYGQNYVGRKLEKYNIGKGQHIILLTLYRNGGINQEMLSDHLRLDKGSIAKSIKKLEDEGYVERSTDAEDKRAYKVYLTQKGIGMIPKVREAIRGWEELIAEELSKEEKDLLEKLLNKMALKADKIKALDKEQH